MDNIEKRGTLILTKVVFSILLKKLIDHFTKKYKIKDNYKETQLFGFGNYNPEKPNFKNDFELVLKGFVNGKYLYNKRREVSTGKPFIKISREYKYIYFNYLGFKDIHEFINQDFFTPDQKRKQLETLQQDNNIEDYYYVCYYYGEDRKMNKGQVIIYKQWKNIEMKYIYVNKFSKTSIYSFFGTITHSEGFVFFDTSFYVGSKKNEGAKYIFFVGKSAPHEREFLIGTYSGFDKYDNTIAGKMILKKYNSKVEIEDEITNKSFDPIICQELNKNRIIVESSIRKNPLLFSKKSPYAQVLLNSAGSYIFDFKIEKNSYKLKFKIEKYHYNIISLNDSIIIEDDKITVLNKGQILNLDFSISGMFHLQKVSIYIKALDFIKCEEETQGIYNGVDINNNIVSGNVIIEPIKNG